MAAATKSTNPIFVTCGDRRTNISPFGYVVLLRACRLHAHFGCRKIRGCCLPIAERLGWLEVATQRTADLSIFRSWDKSSPDTVNVRGLRDFIDLECQ